VRSCPLPKHLLPASSLDSLLPSDRSLRQHSSRQHYGIQAYHRRKFSDQTLSPPGEEYLWAGTYKIKRDAGARAGTWFYHISPERHSNDTIGQEEEYLVAVPRERVTGLSVELLQPGPMNLAATIIESKIEGGAKMYRVRCNINGVVWIGENDIKHG
jgi:hypothetical protein